MIKVSSIELLDKLIDAALANEASLDYSHELRFEIANTNVSRGRGKDSIRKPHNQ